MMWRNFINYLAIQIAFNDWLVHLIIRMAKRNPYGDLQHSDGSPYMRRWWLMPHFLLTLDENDKLFPYSWLPFLIRVHHIQSEDWDRELHDHPAWYRTIILDGWYWEMDIYGNKHLRIKGDTKTASAETFHKILEVSSGGVWTIFIMGRKTNEWGFLLGDRKIPWRKYWAEKLNKETN